MAYQARDLIYSTGLYETSFITIFGERSDYWAKESWRHRELSLRHDMVCMLLCGTDQCESLAERIDRELSAPPPKRQRLELDYSEPSTSSSSSSDKGLLDKEIKVHDVPSSDPQEIDDQHRYVLIEGHPLPIYQQNAAVKRAGLTFKPKHLYDIVDVSRGELIEVKITNNVDEAIHLRTTYGDPVENVVMYIFDPRNGTCIVEGSEFRNPNIHLAVSFLLKRAAIIEDMQYMDTEFPEDKDWVEAIFCCNSLNADVELWKSEIWKWKDVRKIEKPLEMEPAKGNRWDPVNLNELSELIEDCTKRDAEFAPIKMKILPPMMCREMETEIEDDKGMISLLFQNLEFIGRLDEVSMLNWVINRWNNDDVGPFNFITEKESKLIPDLLKIKLGIKMKGTYENDDEDILRQKQFKDKPKLRLSFWVHNMVRDLAMPHDNDLNYMQELQECETEPIHPISKISSKYANSYFECVSKTNIAPLCSKAKGFYSRLGGAFLSREFTGIKKGYLVVFPLYSVGTREGVKVRRVSGFVIRGPHHAKAGSDRIAIITVEMLKSDSYWERYHEHVKNGVIVRDSHGAKWIFRVNSIMKADCSHLVFINNAFLTAANSAGEFAINSDSALTGYDPISAMGGITGGLGPWLMERVAESVMMALMGGSEEEGALAIVRKMFMTAMAKLRRTKVICCDIEGLADALNECLLTSALAMYFAHEMKVTLKTLGERVERT